MLPLYSDWLINILRSKKEDINILESRIVLNCSGVLFGCKPGSTITFVNGRSSYGQLELWEEYKDIITKCSLLRFLELKRCDGYCSILAFDSKKLKHILNISEVCEFLDVLGYDCSGPPDDILMMLKERFKYSVPHEIGILLGIPIKDVQGYMGFNSLNLSCTMGWNMYGSTSQSICLFRHYERCRKNAIHLLSIGINPGDILKTFPIY